MDEAKIETDGLKTIQAELDLIAKIERSSRAAKEIAPALQSGYQRRLRLRFELRISRTAPKSPAGISQGGLGLPNRDYYFKTDDESKSIRDEYLKHVAKDVRVDG